MSNHFKSECVYTNTYSFQQENITRILNGLTLKTKILPLVNILNKTLVNKYQSLKQKGAQIFVVLNISEYSIFLGTQILQDFSSC